MDVVYVLKDTSHNNFDELRYSLRSIEKHLDIRDVFLVGGKPIWVQNIIHIPAQDNKGRSAINVAYKLKHACESELVTDSFIFMNDDFFVINKPQMSEFFAHRGKLAHEVISKRKLYKGNPYWRTLSATLKLDPEMLDYTLHMPMIIEKEKFLRLWQKYDFNQGFSFRAVYGSEYLTPNGIKQDTKIFDFEDLQYLENESFISCDDQTFRSKQFREYLDSKFPEKSKFEADMSKKTIKIRIKRSYFDKTEKKRISTGTQIKVKYNRAESLIKAKVAEII